MNSQKNVFVFRKWILLLIMILLFGACFFRLMRIQVVDAEYYKSKVQGQFTSTQQVRAPRGEILDRNGLALVKNEMS